MAEDSPTPQRDPLVLVVTLLVGALILSGIFQYLRDLFSEDLFEQYSLLGKTVAAFEAALPYIQLFSFILSVALVVGIIYLQRRVGAIRRQEREELYPGSEEDGVAGVFSDLAGRADEYDPTTNPRWSKVQDLLEESNESSWRQALVEADIMLDEMLSHMGYQGESLGERLKQINKAHFNSLDQAWEAHKARNAVAHEGSDYRISQREARRIIDLYRQVFEEFNYI